MNDSLLSVSDLAVEFRTELGTSHALHGINLELQRGRTTAIVGESGSGKSVTAFAIMQLIQRPGRITRGRIMFRPREREPFDVLALGPKDEALYQLRGGDIAMIFQEPMTALSPVHTIGDQVTEAILTHRNITKSSANEIAGDMLERVGIDRARMSQYPFEFSGGMRQRVVIAMALVCNPELLICDEPTTALDVTVQAEILALIRELKSALESTVLFITHDLGVVAQIADDVVVMQGGHILETGTVREILKSPIHPYTRALLDAIPGPGSGARLATVSDALASLPPEPVPPVTLPSGRTVALPLELIPKEERP